MMRSLFVSTLLFTIGVRFAPITIAAPGPVKVFILAGQSNMEGQAVADLEGKDYNGGKGTLNALLLDAAKAPMLAHLKAVDGKWPVRDDVWCWYQRERGDLLAGPLTIGFSVYGDTHHYGPELQFGYVVGDHFSNQVLLIKTAWGGKSLFTDFRPPSSGGNVGPYYTKMIEQVRHALANLKRDIPAYDGAGYELTGFVWYQGWNDGVDPRRAVPEYEANLVNLIHDVRKDLNAPRLPVVIGELTGPWVDAPGSWAKLREAQAGAANRPEFKGNVVFAPTRQFVRKAEESPNPGHGHHEFGNAETYFLVGDALGKAMVGLLSPQPSPPDVAPRAAKDGAGTALHTARKDVTIEGWTLRVDDRLFQPENESLRKEAFRFIEYKLADIRKILPQDKVERLQKVTIVLDLDHGGLKAMQYHPDVKWLVANGYERELVKCVHLPRAAAVASARNTNEQPWVLLHELAHAYHNQVLTFDEPRVIKAYENYKASGRGEKALRFTGKRGEHYALTNHKEFFAEMTEAYFGTNDFYPFNRAELKESEPEIAELLHEIWEGPAKGER